jgi:hypothetical protein
LTLNNKQNEDAKPMMIEQPIETDIKSEKGDETDEEFNNNLTFSLNINPDDFCGTTLANAITDKMHLPNTEWPNNFY